MKAKRSLTHFQVSVIFSTILFLITLTFKSYFYYAPFTNGVDTLSVLQALTLIGWVTLIAVPPLFFASDYVWSKNKFYGFVFSVGLWTAATTLIKLYTLITFGKIWYEYLLTYPTMIVFEWLIPAVYVWIAVNVYKPAKPRRVERNRYRNEEAIEEEREKVDSRERYVD